MNTTANALLASGASPIMAHDPEELEDILNMANALVLNIGTLDAGWLTCMERAGRIASAKGIPIVLDPVGAGASALRTRAAISLMTATRPALLRGNAGEVMALMGSCGCVQGVDSRTASVDMPGAALALSKQYQTIVSVSGPSDIITDGDHYVIIEGGSPLMPAVTGMGCTATAISAACIAAAKAADLPHTAFTGAVTAMCLMAEAGEKAASVSHGPGTFQPAFLDALWNTGSEDLAHHIKDEAGS